MVELPGRDSQGREAVFRLNVYNEGNVETCAHDTFQHVSKTTQLNSAITES